MKIVTAAIAVKNKAAKSFGQLPRPLRRLLRLLWRVSGDQYIRVMLWLLGRCQHFYFPKKLELNWELKAQMLLGRYESETVALLARLIQPGMTIFDIGAHIGYFTRLFATWVGERGKVYAFEPAPENLHFLRKNTSWMSNVFIVDKAVSNTNGTAQFWISKKTGCHSLVDQYHAYTMIEVETITLDTFWNEIGKPLVHVIKMDVEGAEPYVLRGATELIRHHTHLILVTEFSPSALRAGNTEPEEFLELLKSLGFQYWAIGPEGTLLEKLPSLGDYHYINLYCKKSGS